MSEPTILITGNDEGISNKDLDTATKRLLKGKQYKDLSTLCVIPTRGMIPARCVESWWSLWNPMNNRFQRMIITGMEVGDAYQQAVELLLNHPILKDFKYMLTLEEDNAPPADGLLKLLENICDCPEPCREHFVQVAGLYWTKGHGTGQPMIYGDPKKLLTFHPQVPIPDALQECNGTGMGFTLYHTGIFRDAVFREMCTPPNGNAPVFFKTPQDINGTATQDLYNAGRLRQAGFRIASDNRVRVGHWDQTSGTMF